jgi:hypothetical protein
MKVATHPSIAVPHCLFGNKIGNNGNQVKRWKAAGSLKKINKYWSTSIWKTFFFEMGVPQPLHRKDAYGLALFIYSTKTGKKHYNNLTN